MASCKVCYTVVSDLKNLEHQCNDFRHVVLWKINMQAGFLPEENDQTQREGDVKLINTLNEGLCNEVKMLKDLLLEETAKRVKISDECDSYRTALQVLKNRLVRIGHKTTLQLCWLATP